MTPNELYAVGYAIEYSPWGVYVYRETLDHMETLETTTVSFERPVTSEEAQRRGWEAATVDFVKRRLDVDAKRV